MGVHTREIQTTAKQGQCGSKQITCVSARIQKFIPTF